jgi:hypothetical protein
LHVLPPETGCMSTKPPRDVQMYLALCVGRAETCQVAYAFRSSSATIISFGRSHDWCVHSICDVFLTVGNVIVRRVETDDRSWIIRYHKFQEMRQTHHLVGLSRPSELVESS